jgi:hypothetical protein
MKTPVFALKKQITVNADSLLIGPITYTSTTAISSGVQILAISGSCFQRDDILKEVQRLA